MILMLKLKRELEYMTNALKLITRKKLRELLHTSANSKL